MGNAEVWVMFGGGGIVTFNREGREARPPGLPACSLLASLAHIIHVALLLSLLCLLALSQNCRAQRSLVLILLCNGGGGFAT